jgi:iron complex transport system substrate-binding protein
MRPVLRILLPALLVIGATACGSDSNDRAGDTAPTTPSSATAVSDDLNAAADTTTITADTAVAATEVPHGSAPGTPVEMIEVEGAYGPIEIPTDPQRIVADLMTVDYLTALGYDTSKIVAVFEAEWFAGIDDHYLADFFAEQQPIDPGPQWDVNLEALAAAEPDLIIAPFDQLDRSPQLAQIQQIAPTLVIPTSEGEDPEGRYGGTASFQDWRSTIRSYGNVLGLEAEAEAYVAESEAALASLETEFGDLIASTTATQAKSTPDSMAINVLSADSERGVLGSILMSELGFTAPEAQAGIEPDEYGTIELSAETVNLLDGDLLFLEVRSDATGHSDSPLWETLGVVQADNVITVGNHWEYGGAVAARIVIDDLRAALETYAAKT